MLPSHPNNLSLIKTISIEEPCRSNEFDKMPRFNLGQSNFTLQFITILAVNFTKLLMTH